MRFTALLTAGLILTAAAATAKGRTDRVLRDGWTADGTPVAIPHCWNVEDACDGKDVPAGWRASKSVSSPSYERKRVNYRRALPDPTPGRRQFIRFEGASATATVKVNGQTLGTHKGAFTAFAFELTALLRPAGNTLEVEVDNFVDRDLPPWGGDFVIYGGLYRDVHFIETDPVCIDSLTDGADNIVIDADPKTGDVIVRVKVLGGTNEVQRFHFAEPKLWSPETPTLYRLAVEVAQNGSFDAITVPFGFRTVEFRPDGFYLNGRRRMMKGVNRHQDREGKGWALSAQDHRDDFRLIKKMGADAVRFCHYPHSSLEYAICDELGLLVWAELPNVNGVEPSAAFKENLYACGREFVAQQRNHPSIFTWSIFNEIGNDFSPDDRQTVAAFLRDFNAAIKALDPTRPTSAATCKLEHVLDGEWPDPWPGLNAITDIIAWNVYPGWYVDTPESMDSTLNVRRLDTPHLGSIGVSEYGCGGSAFQHGDPFTPTVPNSRLHPDDYQARCHWSVYRQMSARDDLWGTFVWNMFDFASDARHEGAHDGRNDKGLVEFDHQTLKSSYHFYQTNWTKEPKLYLVGWNRTETTNAVANVMGFCNVGAVLLTVNGKAVGAQEPDAVKTVVFRNVQLTPGANEIRLEANGLSAGAVWNLK